MGKSEFALGVSQRWRARREWRVPSGGVIDTRRYGVDIITEREAKAFVVDHHYSGSYPAARLAVGLFERRGAVRQSELVGVAVFGVPMNQRVVPRYLGVEANQGIELSRLVLLDRVPGNGESWFVARAFRLLRHEKPEVVGVVSYCDPVERRTASGQILMPGHVGIIYQALNGIYRGRGSARTLWLSAEGTVISERTVSKLRQGDQGAEYAERQLLSVGVPKRKAGENAGRWLSRIKDSGALKAMRHPGNHVYAFGLTKGMRQNLGCSEAALYPK